MYSLVFGSDLQQSQLKDDSCPAPPRPQSLLLVSAAENLVFLQAPYLLKPQIPEEERVKQDSRHQSRMQIFTFCVKFPYSLTVCFKNGMFLLWWFGWDPPLLSNIAKSKWGKALCPRGAVGSVSNPEEEGGGSRPPAAPAPLAPNLPSLDSAALISFLRLLSTY